jgi:two-component system, sensor histidine kinase LadS
LFIIRELNWISDNYLTRYAVQYGVIAQVVLFSLGLSSRLNQAQVKVTQMELDKERERKQLLEEQSQLLQQKVAEQTADLRALNHLKDKLLSIISHDLRNPLVSLDSFLNLLINHHDRLTEQERMTLTQKARQSLSNLNQLLSNLLLWSRSQINQVVFNPQLIDIKSIIESAIELHSLDIELKNIKIETSIDKLKDIVVDAEMVDFIVRNLLGNAIKFSFKNGVIKIQVNQKDKGFVLSVIDEGVGMTEEQIQKIATQKIIPSTRGTAKEKGSGLGLVLCREFVEMHGGSMEITSDKLTVVSCYLRIDY